MCRLSAGVFGGGRGRIAMGPEGSQQAGCWAQGFPMGWSSGGPQPAGKVRLPAGVSGEARAWAGVGVPWPDLLHQRRWRGACGGKVGSTEHGEEPQLAGMGRGAR